LLARKKRLRCDCLCVKPLKMWLELISAVTTNILILASVMNTKSEQFLVMPSPVILPTLKCFLRRKPLLLRSSAGIVSGSTDHRSLVTWSVCNQAAKVRLAAPEITATKHQIYMYPDAGNGSASGSYCWFHPSGLILLLDAFDTLRSFCYLLLQLT